MKSASAAAPAAALWTAAGAAYSSCGDPPGAAACLHLVEVLRCEPPQFWHLCAKRHGVLTQGSFKFHLKHGFAPD